MNTRTLIASLSIAFAAASPVMAQEASPGVAAISGQLSRAEVAAAATQSVRSGQHHELFQIQHNTAVAQGLSRDAVRAETVAALQSGAAERLDAEAQALGLVDRSGANAMSATRLSR